MVVVVVVMVHATLYYRDIDLCFYFTCYADLNGVVKTKDLAHS